MKKPPTTPADALEPCHCAERQQTLRPAADVAECRQAGERSGEKPRPILDTGAEALVQIDADGIVTRWNGQAAAIFGWTEAQALGQAVHGLIVPPRFREAYRLGLRLYFDAGDALPANHRVAMAGLHRDGREFPIELTLTLLAPAVADGKPAVRAFIRDASGQRAREEEMQLAALVYQAISEAIMVADADNRIVAVNPAFSRLTGYSAEEAIGQRTSLLKSGRQGAEFYRQMWHALNAAGHWQGEIWNRRKNGETYIEWLSISTIYDAGGAVLRRVAMFSDLTEQKRNEATIWRQANYDTLTGLPNRSLFHDRLLQEVKAVRREGHSLALMLIDLDRFKEVNDTFGHAIGDRLLVETARRVGACIREADTLARLGGDEFTVILPGLTDASRIERAAQEIIDAVVKPYTLGHEVAHVSASIGITLYPSDAADPETLMKNADQAMYAAKSQGRNRYSYFTAGMQRAALERQRLGQDLRGALAAGQLVVYYQPIVNLATGRFAKAEALLRWRHPANGLVESSEFIHLAEELGLINTIGDWVFKEAARLAKKWRESHADCIQVGVNKSPRQFMECVLKENWIAHLREIGLPAACIAIEVAESLLLDDRPEITGTLAQFSDAGIQITIDDFGAGYTAMSYFKKYRIDYLKIDRSLVRDMVDGPGDLAIVEAIIAMAHRLGVQVIAEGVETAAQRDLLAAAGCDYAQGYWFARPMPAEELNARLGRE